MDDCSLIALQPIISIIWSDEGTHSYTGIQQPASRPRVHTVPKRQLGDYRVHLTFFVLSLRFVELMQQVVPCNEGNLLQSHDYGLKVSFPPLICSDKCSCLPFTCDNAQPSRLLFRGSAGSGMEVLCTSVCAVPSAKWLRARLAPSGHCKRSHSCLTSTVRPPG